MFVTDKKGTFGGGVVVVVVVFLTRGPGHFVDHNYMERKKSVPPRDSCVLTFVIAYT